MYLLRLSLALVSGVSAGFPALFSLFSEVFIWEHQGIHLNRMKTLAKEEDEDADDADADAEIGRAHV